YTAPRSACPAMRTDTPIRSLPPDNVARVLRVTHDSYTSAATHPAERTGARVYPARMILEIDTEAIRDIAAAVHAARRIEPDIEILAAVERKVMTAIRERSEILELGDQEAQSLRNVPMRRAYEQRNTTDGT